MINALNVAQTGLAAAKSAVENVMNNIANENTPGYKKRTVNLQELGHNDSRIVGRGVSVENISRATSDYMYNNLINEGTKESYYQELSGLLEGAESLFKETDASGFSADLNRYFQSVENLRSNPNSEVYKNDLKTQGTIIVDALQRLYEGIETQEAIAKNSLEDDLATMNGILQDIGSINQQLGQEFEASNDLLDRRDLLEEELSKYINIDVDRDIDDYQLEIGGATAVRHSTNIREVSLVEEYTAQKDKYINDDYLDDPTAVASSILNGLTFDNNDVITYKLDNEFSTSITFGEEMTFDLDGDGILETITVDETNYVRALVEKINNTTGMMGQVIAYNGDYALDDEGNKVTLNGDDSFLNILAADPGRVGKFEGTISFVEQEDTQVGLVAVGELALSSISSDKKMELIADPQQNMTHTVSFTGASTVATEHDFSIAGGTGVDGLGGTVIPSNFDTGTDFDGVTFTNGVTYDASTGKITVPAGVNEFDISFPIVNDGAVGDTDYAITIGSLAPAVGTIKQESSPAELVSITSDSVEETTASGASTTLVHTVSLSGPATGGGVESINFVIDDIFNTQKGIEIDGEKFSADARDFGALATAINGSDTFIATYDSAANTITVTDEGNALNTTTFSTYGKTFSDLATDITANTTFGSSPYIPGNDNTDAPSLDFTSDVASVDIEYFDSSGTSLGTVTFAGTTTPIVASAEVPTFPGDLELPAGTASFTISMPVSDDDAGEFTEQYSLSVTDGTDTLATTGEITDDDIGTSKLILRNDYQSTESANTFGISVYDKIIPITSGSMKAQLDNLNTESGMNKFEKYKADLDDFANTLSDISDQYMRNDDGTYVYGEKAIDDLGNKQRDVANLGLFTGSDVSSLKFNITAVNDLDQNDLDYLATMQFKTDIYFNGKPQGSMTSEYEDENSTTFLDYFQSVRVGVATDKENNDFLKDTQESVKQSIQTSYDQITKVDRDEEMLNLIKFQAAYTANAKLVTVVDEMLDTLLGLKR